MNTTKIPPAISKIVIIVDPPPPSSTDAAPLVQRPGPNEHSDR